MKRYKISRFIVLFFALFVGVGAFWGSLLMFQAPDGSLLQMNGLLPYFQVLPFASLLFQDYIFSGIALSVFNCIPNLIAGILILFERESGLKLGCFQGLILMAWITIQFVIFPANVLSTSYFIFGLLQFVFGFIAFVSYRQVQAEKNLKPFRKAVAKADTLYVNFTREGYSAAYAIKLAERDEADFLSLKTGEPVYHTGGFWNAGRHAMHSWPMATEPYSEKVADYRKVVIVTPVWAFGISAPIRRYLIDNADALRNVETEYIIFHFNLFKYAYIAKHMDEIIGKKASKVVSVCDKWGKIRFEKVIREKA
jgi:hypothetical protein